MNKVEKIKAEIKRLKQSNKALVEDCPYYDGLTDALDEILSFIDSLEEPVSDELLEKAAIEAFKQIVDSDKNNFLEIFKAGAQWQKENLWKDAQGDDLPEYEREAIVLCQPYPLEGNEYSVSFAHRPNPDGWYGKSLTTGEVEHYTPKTYDKGGWNQPNVVYWLDVELPKEEE